MFASKQVESLLTKIQHLYDSASNEGCESGLAVVDSNDLLAVVQEARQLRNLNPRLLLGRHEHRHGESLYMFLVPAGTVFDEKSFEQRLIEDYEPEKEEFLRINDMGEPSVIEVP